MGKTAAADADGVDLCHVFGNGTECGHGAEGDTLEIHVETCNYDALACVGQIDAYAHQFVIEKLRLVNANNFGVFGQFNDSCRCAYWGGVDGIGIVRYHILVAITRVDGWFVYFYFLLGYFCAAQAADEFFGFAGELIRRLLQCGRGGDFLPEKVAWGEKSQAERREAAVRPAWIESFIFVG